jgi:hypothetical protein
MKRDHCNESYESEDPQYNRSPAMGYRTGADIFRTTLDQYGRKMTKMS